MNAKKILIKHKSYLLTINSTSNFIVNDSGRMFSEKDSNIIVRRMRISDLNTNFTANF